LIEKKLQQKGKGKIIKILKNKKQNEKKIIWEIEIEIEGLDWTKKLL
jgi:hypothetical protein